VSLPAGSPEPRPRRDAASAKRPALTPVDRLLDTGFAFVVCFCGRHLIWGYCDECGYEHPDRRAWRVNLELEAAAREAAAAAEKRRRRAWARGKAARRRRYLAGR
jgi:hypothetical protein